MIGPQIQIREPVAQTTEGIEPVTITDVEALYTIVIAYQDFKILVSASSPTTATMMKFGFIFSIVAGVLGGLGVIFLIIFIVLLVARSKAKKRAYQA